MITTADFLKSIAERKLANGLADPLANVWLPVLLQLDPVSGIDSLENGIKNSEVSRDGEGVRWFAKLFGRDFAGISVDPSGPGFTPELLLRLVRLAYQHVRVSDNAYHEGSYTSDTRDHAERGRDAVLSALLATRGAEGWAAKLAMANHPLFAHFKDRAIALARKTSAEEADSTALTDSEFALLDKYGELPPSTREAMFALMRDRLDDIDDLLLQDVSPREVGPPSVKSVFCGAHWRMNCEILPTMLTLSIKRERRRTRKKRTFD